jgi:4,5-DOPA dioxygenase extradiol
MTHNLHEFYSSELPPDAPAKTWVADFADWVHDKIEAGAIEDLVNYRKLAPHALDNHPTEEHFLPLFVALGAGANGSTKGRRIHSSTRSGVISMDTYAFG